VLQFLFVELSFKHNFAGGVDLPHLLGISEGLSSEFTNSKQG
jgi:hypothetical protein